jgi:hypothetical protein
VIRKFIDDMDGLEQLANPANRMITVEHITDLTLAKKFALAESTRERIVRVEGEKIIVETANCSWSGMIRDGSAWPENGGCPVALGK